MINYLKKCCLLLCFGAASFFSAAQQDASIADLSFYADVLVNATEGDHRVRANDAFMPLLETYLSSEGYSAQNLEAVKWISQQRPEAADFTIFTWQVKASEDAYRSYGFIRHDDGMVTPLKEAPFGLADIQFEVRDANSWIGGLYYHSMPTQVDGQDAWLLFGYSGYGRFDRMKFVDVLTFDDNRQPIFGAEIFKKQGAEAARATMLNRLMLVYSMDSRVTLNYNPGLELIIHDHLINRMGTLPGQGETWLSDGSYEGYKWDGEYWVYDEKVFEQVVTEGNYPRPNPVLDRRKEGRGK